jgi:hypothetical protein
VAVEAFRVKQRAALRYNRFPSFGIVQFRARCTVSPSRTYALLWHRVFQFERRVRGINNNPNHGAVVGTNEHPAVIGIFGKGGRLAGQF